MWEEVAWGVESGMATGVDDLYVDWAGYEGENRKNGGGRGGWREEEKEDEEEEVDDSRRCSLSDLKKLAPGCNCQIGKLQPIVYCFRYRSFLMWHRLGLLSRNGSPLFREAWRAGADVR